MNKVRKRILHVDDDQDTRKYIAVILSDIADVTPATSIQRARELIKETDYDLILVDFTLADGSGSELINELAKENSTIPVIILSAHEITNNMVNVKHVFIKGRLHKQTLIDAIRPLITT